MANFVMSAIPPEGSGVQLSGILWTCQSAKLGRIAVLSNEPEKALNSASQPFFQLVNQSDVAVKR